MYKCKECSYQMSSNADACPNCGNNDPFYEKQIKSSYKKKHSDNKIVWLVGGAIFFFVMIILNLIGIDSGGTFALITLHISFWNIFVLIAITIGLIIYSVKCIFENKEISTEIDKIWEKQRKLEI